MWPSPSENMFVYTVWRSDDLQLVPVFLFICSQWITLLSEEFPSSPLWTDPGSSQARGKITRPPIKHYQDTVRVMHNSVKTIKESWHRKHTSRDWNVTIKTRHDPETSAAELRRWAEPEKSRSHRGLRWESSVFAKPSSKLNKMVQGIKKNYVLVDNKWKTEWVFRLSGSAFIVKPDLWLKLWMHSKMDYRTEKGYCEILWILYYIM